MTTRASRSSSRVTPTRSVWTWPFLAYLAELQKCGRSKQMAKVCHLRAENKRGSSLVLDFMEVNSKHEHGLYKDTDVLEGIKKAG